MLTLRRPWVDQPPDVVELNDYGRQLGCVSSLLMSARGYDVVRRKQLVTDGSSTAANNATYVGSPFGVSLRGASSAAGIAYETGGGFESLIASGLPYHVMLLVRVNSLGTRRIIFADFSSAGISESILLEQTAANAWNSYMISGATPFIAAGGSVTVGWHWVELFSDTLTHNISVDGAATGSVSVTGAPRRSGTDLRVGRAGAYTLLGFEGDVAAAMIFNKVLSAQERASLRGNPNAIYTDRVTRIYFNDGTATNPALVGVQGTWAPGSIGLSVSASLGLTGNQGTWSPGSVAAQTASSLALSGVQGAWSLGTVGLQVDASRALSGVVGTWDAGSVSASTASSLALSNVLGSWSAGSVTPTVDAIRALTGLEGTWGIGDVTPQTASSFALSGNPATWGAGNVSGSTATSVDLSGNQGTWGVGTLSPSGSTALALSGNVATWAPGAVTPSVSAARSLAGEQGTWSVGTVSPVGSTALALSGVQATWQPGSVSGSTATSAALTGNQGTWGIGNVAPIAGTALALSGNQSAWAVGSVIANPTLRITGVQASWSAGMVAVVGDGSTPDRDFSRDISHVSMRTDVVHVSYARQIVVGH